MACTMIDLDGLKRACEGDQTKKVTVTKAWLREIHKELSKRALTDKIHPNVKSVLERLYGK